MIARLKRLWTRLKNIFVTPKSICVCFEQETYITNDAWIKLATQNNTPFPRDEDLINDLMSLPIYNEWTRDEVASHLYAVRKRYHDNIAR